jgi:hypothetical protein
VGFISVRESAHLKAVVIAMTVAERDIAASIRKETRAIAAPVWRDELNARPATVQQTRMLVDTARVKASSNTITLTAATQKRRVLSGGASPAGQGKAYEFGSTRGHGRQLPAPRRGGYVVYPALAHVAPRIISMWAQTVMRGVGDSLDGKR